MCNNPTMLNMVRVTDGARKKASEKLSGCYEGDALKDLQGDCSALLKSRKLCNSQQLNLATQVKRFTEERMEVMLSIPQGESYNRNCTKISWAPLGKKLEALLAVLQEHPNRSSLVKQVQSTSTKSKAAFSDFFNSAAGTDHCGALTKTSKLNRHIHIGLVCRLLHRGLFNSLHTIPMVNGLPNFESEIGVYRLAIRTKV